MPCDILWDMLILKIICYLKYTFRDLKFFYFCLHLATLGSIHLYLWPWECRGTGHILPQIIYQIVRNSSVSPASHWTFSTLSPSPHTRSCHFKGKPLCYLDFMSLLPPLLMNNHSPETPKMSIHRIYMLISSQLLNNLKNGLFWLKSIWWN